MISKIEMTQAILAAKEKKKASWRELSQKVGLSEIFTVSACLGQNTFSREEAETLGNTLELDKQVIDCLQLFPSKGPGQTISTDPLIYRFFEICFVYGPTLKEVIHEKFGDGIMSAIDFSMQVDKIEDPKGDRVKVTLNGKFLPYKKW